jgi:hypothetical protein
MIFAATVLTLTLISPSTLKTQDQDHGPTNDKQQHQHKQQPRPRKVQNQDQDQRPRQFVDVVPILLLVVCFFFLLSCLVFSCIVVLSCIILYCPLGSGSAPSSRVSGYWSLVIGQNSRWKGEEERQYRTRQQDNTDRRSRRQVYFQKNKNNKLCGDCFH